MHVGFLPLLVLTMQVAGQPADYSSAPPEVLYALPLGELRVVVDGRLEEPVWERADVATGFVQHQPTPGAPASRATEAWVAFDDSHLYVAMRLHDHPDSVAAHLTRRDEWGSADWAQVLIDSRHDRRTEYQFGVSPSGGRVRHPSAQRLRVRQGMGRRMGSRRDRRLFRLVGRDADPPVPASVRHRG